MVFTRVTETTLKEMDNYVHAKLGDEYDLDMLGVTLRDSEYSARQCVAYLYVFEPMTCANQVVQDYFASEVAEI